MGNLTIGPNARTRSRLTIPQVPGSIVSDTFNRANNSSSMGNADTGQTWVPSLGTWGVISNTAYQPVNATGTGQRDSNAVIDSGVVACTIQVEIVTQQSGNELAGGLVFRYQDTSNFFLLMYYRSGGGSAFWYCQKYVAGAASTLGSGSRSGLTGILKVVDTGTTVAAFDNGVQVMAPVSNSQLNTKTKQGIFAEYNSTAGANDGTGWRFDNYSVV